MFRPTTWGAYVPALPGLGVVGETRAEVKQLIGEAIPFHLEGVAEDGLPIPDPTSIEVETGGARPGLTPLCRVTDPLTSVSAQ